jgi:hypothetical protein
VQVPLGQLLPQPPQLPGSLSKSTQLPEQHIGVVKPCVVQSSPQPPQLFTSVVVSSTQEPVVSSELGQQAGLLPEQVVPQLPQLLGSWLTSVQLPLQDMFGADPQSCGHAPMVQVVGLPEPSVQTLPQYPQLFASLFRSVQAPAEPSAFGQQPGVVPVEQEVPQAPQLLVSVVPSVQLLVQHRACPP